MTTHIPSAAPASDPHRKSSADDTGARPAAFAVSPALGPVPAIYVRPSPGQTAMFEAEIDPLELNEQPASPMDACAYRDLAGV